MKEDDIRKRDVFNKYLELVGRDVKKYFDFKSFIEVGCPACGGKSNKIEFIKEGFHYVTCKTCETLFVNPRPPYEILNTFYSQSPSTSFWVNEFFKPVAEARREKIFRPRAEHISRLMTRDNMMVGDIGAGFGLFLDELRKIKPDNHFVAIEPSVEMAGICKNKGLDVECACMEEITDIKGKFDLLTAFELLEHLFDPLLFLKKAFLLLKPGGHLFITTLNGMGFDILILWEKSKSVSPPHHLNFFNTKSIEMLMKKTGFAAIETSTPGRLDWDIVEGMIKREGINCGNFWNRIAHTQGDTCKSELQDWLANNNLSSHMRVVSRKPN